MCFCVYVCCYFILFGVFWASWTNGLVFVINLIFFTYILQIFFSFFPSQFSHVGFRSHISTFDHWQLANHCPFLCWRPTGLWGTLCHGDIESFRCSQVNLETQILNWKHISAEMRCRFSCTCQACWKHTRWCHCREKGKQTKGAPLCLKRPWPNSSFWRVSNWLFPRFRVEAVVA